MTRLGIYNTFFFLLILAVFCGIGKLLSPFAGPLLAALMCAVTFYPMYKKLHRWFPKLSPSLRAGMADALVLIFFVTPIAVLTWAVMQESNTLIPILKQGQATVAQLRQGEISTVLPYFTPVRHFMGESFGIRNAEFQEHLAAFIDGLLEHISLVGSFLAKNILTFILDVFVMLFALFFMFRDGHRFSDYVQDIAPMRRENKERLETKIHDTVIGLVRGLLLTSVIQGATAALGYFLVGLKAAVILGAMTSLMGLVPLVGTFGIWVPISVAFFLKGAYFKGMFILLWGGILVVGIMDTVVRPYLVGKKAELPMFALFLALLGGMEVWGAKGVLLGPLLVGIAPILVEIYKEQYSRQKANLNAFSRPHAQKEMVEL